MSRKKTAKKTNTHTNWNQTEHKDIKQKNKTIPTIEQNQTGKQNGISDLYFVDWSDKTPETENGRMNSGYEYACKCKKH